VPDVLSTYNPTMDLQKSQSVKSRYMRLQRTLDEWTISEVTWKKIEESGFNLTFAKPVENTVEIWEIENKSGGWFHPLHIHLIDFKILDRNGKAPYPYEQGPKDVVYVGENEKVRVIMRFEGACGRYMVHCHNLVHEDHDMMTQFEVVHADGSPGDDPFSDPCKDLPELNDL
jgi:FtsP/CotA-like multicopper oxidase with cupredoxin domain